MNLEEYKNRKALTTPGGYFEQLDDRILAATSKATSKPAQKRTVYIWARFMGYAATIALLFLVGTGIKSVISINDTEKAEFPFATAQENENDDIIDSEYIENMLSSYPIDDYTFYCFVTDTSFE